MLTYASKRQPMTNRLVLLAHWSIRQKLNRVSSVRLRRYVRALTQRNERNVRKAHNAEIDITFCFFCIFAVAYSFYQLRPLPALRWMKTYAVNTRRDRRGDL